MKLGPISFFLTLYIFSIVPAKAQNCNCAEYEKLKTVYASTESNIFIEKLQASNITICKAKAAEWLGNKYKAENNFDSAELYFIDAEKIYHQTSCSDSILLSTYKSWTQLYHAMGEFAKAQEKAFKYLSSAESAGNTYETALSFCMIAQIFNQINQANKGIVYTRKAIALCDKIKDLSKKTDVYFKISKRLLWHYQDTKAESSLDSSELFAHLQLKLATENNLRSFIASAYSSLQGVAWEKKDLSKALLLLDSSFRYTDTTNYIVLGSNYYDKADILMNLKNYKAAIAMADSSIYYRNKTGNVEYEALGLELVSRIYQESGDYKNALDYSLKARTIRDSLSNKEKNRQVTELEKKYNQAKNEKKITELAQQKKFYILLAAAGLFALTGLIFFIRQQSLKNKQKVLETEQRLNRARMNPHFFFNALSSLQSFALESNDGKSVAINLAKFSHIMRETLESTYKEYVSIEEESNFLREYLELQKIRFPYKFSYEINIASSIEPEYILIPSMILQPFAENSIEHGFTGIDYEGKIIISFDKKDNNLTIAVSDNGKGLIATKENSEHISRATQIIKDRIYLLNTKLKTRAGFTIENNKNEKGVSVHIILPLLDKNDIKNS